ncbi:unnamed protein product [Rangifer tarandus platyrhynchus]|uniref:Uncharacterized protein n=1 Tax=Rangifer tarandus platyrhynchus TaxID=3082113 RepID=A0AC59YZ26_RANTA
METPLCLLPGLPLVGPSFSHLLFGRWDSVTAAGAPQPLPSCSLCLFPPGRAGDWPSPRQGQPFGAVPEHFLWSLAHREGAQTPAPCPAQQASPALLCPPWSQKGQVCSRGLGLTPHCPLPDERQHFNRLCGACGWHLSSTTCLTLFTLHC